MNCRRCTYLGAYDNLYVGLESRSKENPECWESYTDITVNLNSLPPFHAYVDNRDCNRHVHDFCPVTE